VLDASPRGTLWYTAQPEIRTVAVKGDYVASREETSSVIALGGTVIAEYSKGTGFLPPRLVEAGTGVRIRANGAIEDETLPARGWWTSGVWREALPFLRFPTWVMILMLLGLAGAAFYHLRVRSRRDKEARQDP
jgi:hypothetical protein